MFIKGKNGNPILYKTIWNFALDTSKEARVVKCPTNTSHNGTQNIGQF
jgi:hypothetical protein